ncbi:MAG TPA: hypothetical protein VG778_08080, partial [Blastocatellia bacterium]|nr:hypothetical protein [Blastocatellia bacterium]
EFRTSERDAMQAMRGVWGFAGSPPPASNSIPEPLASAPKEEKRRLSPLAPSEIGPNLPATTGLSGPITPSEPLVLVSSGDRMYHKSGCEYLGKKHKSLGVSQAKAEGYSSCSRCFASTVLKAR